MGAAVVDLDALDLLDLVQVADAAPDDRAAALGLVLELGGEVAAEEGAVDDLVEQVHDHDVVLDQAVDGGLIVAALEAELAGLGGGDLVQVLAQGHTDAGQRAAHQAVILRGVGGHEVALGLELIAQGIGAAPDLLQGQLAHALQNGRGHLGPAVLHALARPLGRELDDVFLCVKEHVKLPLAGNLCIELFLSYHISAGGTSECTKNAEKPPQHFAMRTRAAPRFVS